MPENDFELQEALIIGDNDCGYQFCVGRIDDRWIGFAKGACDEGTTMMFIFPNVGERGVLGLPSRDEAIRRTAAVAQDREDNYGGVDRWYIHEELQASPDEYRCEDCGTVCCQGDCLDDFWC